MSTSGIKLTERMAAFVEDYQWLSSFGLTDEAIAARLGLKPDTLDRRLFRTGLKGSIVGSDPELHAQLVTLIDSGSEFTAADFSFAFDPEDVRSVLGVAARMNMIVKVGKRSHPLIERKQVSVFCAAPGLVAEPEPIEEDTASTWPDAPSRDETSAQSWAAVAAAFGHLAEVSERSAA